MDLGNLHIIAKITAFRCVTPCSVVRPYRGVTEVQAGSIFRVEFLSRGQNETCACALNDNGTGVSKSL
jgi:hypothetical protein